MIRFVDVHKSYRVDGKDIPALQPFSLDIVDGEVSALSVCPVPANRRLYG